MEVLQPQGPLELEIANFGPIVKAKVDLRPLTVFIGPSNTGKSYLAILIYALHRHFGDRLSWPVPHRLRPGNRIFHYDTPPYLSKETHEALWELANKIVEERSVVAEGIDLHSPVADGISTTLDAHDVQLGNEIGRCFGLDKIRALIRKGSRGGSNIILRKHFKNHSEPVEQKLKIRARAKEIEFSTTVPEGRIAPQKTEEHQFRSLIHAAEELVAAGEPEDALMAAHVLMEYIADLLCPRIIAPLDFPAFYLPADRTGVMHAHSVVVSALIESATMTGLRPAARTPMLSGVLADFLDQLITLDRPRRHWRSSSWQDFGSRIEKAILGGSVIRNKSETTDYPHFAYLPEKWKGNNALPLMTASSMVSELAPLVLYLRDIVTRNNVMIVEEPESHLHPAMQVELTKILALLVRSGIRVIVTTHSEWILEELANVVRRSELPDSNAGKDHSLRHDQVGAWLFKPSKRSEGSEVKEIRLDDSGTYPSGFDEVAVALHNDWAEIASRLEENE